MRVAVAASVVLSAIVALAACAGDDPAPAAPQSDGTEADVKGSAVCRATLRYLQKDAYKSVAGRTSPLWPPHTTTQLDITCDEKVVASSFQENHGTKPADLDPSGAVYLVETKTDTAPGKRRDLDKLAAAYAACSCEAATKFLSLNDVEDAEVQKVVAELVTYAGAHLACTGARSGAEVAGLLEKGDLPGFLDALSECSFEAGKDFQKGFDEALGKLLAASATTLSGYHVCNNDAALQDQIFTTFRETGKVVACDATSRLCGGPRWSLPR